MLPMQKRPIGLIGTGNGANPYCYPKPPIFVRTEWPNESLRTPIKGMLIPTAVLI